MYEWLIRLRVATADGNGLARAIDWCAIISRVDKRINRSASSSSFLLAGYTHLKIPAAGETGRLVPNGRHCGIS